MPVRAVLFDLDDTLFDHDACARAALDGLRSGYACFAGIDAARLEEAHARILEELHVDVIAGRLELDAARVERFRRLATWSGVEGAGEEAARMAAAYRRGYLEARREIRGAKALLAALSRRVHVVVVSNNLLEEQREKLRHCGLERYVRTLVVSEEAGVSKPDPRIFAIALSRAGVEPQDAVMVGDSWTNDVEGARASGIRAIWFNRRGAPPPDPDVEMLQSLEPVDEALRLILTPPRPSLTRERASAFRA